MKKIHVALTGYFLLLASVVTAQDFSSIMTELNKIKDAYKGNGFISYQMKYLYAKESAPAKYLDSLTGHFKTHDSSFYGKLGKIEFVQDDKTNIAIYGQDKMMMLSKPVKQDDKLMPLASWDSLFVAYNMDTTVFTDKNGLRTIDFKFSPVANYKEFIIQYDLKTHWLKKIVMTTRQTPVDEGPGKIKADGNIVTILFSNYSTAAFDSSVFAASRYVSLESQAPAPNTSYAGYRLVDLRKSGDVKQ